LIIFSNLDENFVCRIKIFHLFTIQY
jgi:hypothetical protein